MARRNRRDPENPFKGGAGGKARRISEDERKKGNQKLLEEIKKRNREKKAKEEEEKTRRKIFYRAEKVKIFLSVKPEEATEEQVTRAEEDARRKRLYRAEKVKVFLSVKPEEATEEQVTEAEINKQEKEKEIKFCEEWKRKMANNPSIRIDSWFPYLREYYFSNPDDVSIYVFKVKQSCRLKPRYDTYEIKTTQNEWDGFYVGQTALTVKERYEERHMIGRKSRTLKMDCLIEPCNYQRDVEKWTNWAGFIECIPREEAEIWEAYVGWALAQAGYVVFGPHIERPPQEYPFL